jgi:hypothetical protein
LLVVRWWRRRLRTGHETACDDEGKTVHWSGGQVFPVLLHREVPVVLSTVFPIVTTMTFLSEFSTLVQFAFVSFVLLTMGMRNGNKNRTFSKYSHRRWMISPANCTPCNFKELLTAGETFFPRFLPGPNSPCSLVDQSVLRVMGFIEIALWIACEDSLR